MPDSKSIHASPAFAVWLTGLPASGKSTITRALVARLHGRGVRPAALESDVLRRVMMPQAGYSDADRDRFYGTMAALGKMLVEQGVPVIFDATANRRRYRDAARQTIERFIEVWVRTPLAICQQRDPKGIYSAASPAAGHVPGVSAEYEPPIGAEVVVEGDRQSPDDAAAAIMAALEERGFVSTLAS